MSKANESFNLFHNIIAAQLKGNPKYNPDLNKTLQFLKNIEEAVAVVVPDWQDYAFLQINGTTRGICYSIDGNCPVEKCQKIEQVIMEQTSLLNITVTTNDID